MWDYGLHGSWQANGNPEVNVLQKLTYLLQHDALCM